MYDLILNSEYKKYTLDSLYRHEKSIQFQSFVLSYTFIKYNKKVKHIPFKFIYNTNSILDSYNYSLFCINTGPFNDLDILFLKSRIVMEYLFPIPSAYEIYNFSLSSIAFKVVKYLQKIIDNKCNNSKNVFIQKKIDTFTENNTTNNFFPKIGLHLSDRSNIILLFFFIFFKIILKYINI